MKTVAYLRISTTSQDIDNQRLAIWDYAYQNQMTIDQFIEVVVSSRKNSTDRGIDQLLCQLSPADTLLVSELSRLGRSVGQIVTLVDQLIQRQVRLIAIKEGIELYGQQDLQTKVMITMFSLFAEIERDLISQRTKEGLAKARTKGKILGRPKGSTKSKLDGREEEIRLLLEKGLGKTSIAKIIGVSRSSVRHFILTRELD